MNKPFRMLSGKLVFPKILVLAGVALLSAAGGCSKEEPADTTPPPGAEVQGIDKMAPKSGAQPVEKMSPKMGKNRAKTAP